MTISPAVTAEIRRLYYAEHWKRGTIASELGVHFDAVVRVLGTLGPKAGTPRPEARVLEPYITFVDPTLARHPKLVATRIQDMIVARGYAGSLRTLRRYVRGARPAPKNEVFVRCPASKPRSTGHTSERSPSPADSVRSGRSSWCSRTRAPCGPSSSSTWASTRFVARSSAR